MVDSRFPCLIDCAQTDPLPLEGELGIRIKLTEIARRCGVSISTVSRVMNQKPGVDEKTRERILEALEELQFDPSQPVMRRHSANNPLIAFLIPDPMKWVGLTTYVYLSEIRAIQEVAEASGFGLFVGTYRGQESPTPADRMIRSGQFQGAIVTRTRNEDLDFQEFREARIPFVVLNRAAQQGDGVHSVWVDDIQAGRKAAAHFLKMGHRRIALLLGSPNIPTSANRTRGFRQAHAAAGIPCRDELIIQTDLTEEGAREAVSHLLSLPESPTALVALNDTMAIAAMAVARENGLRVPQDLAVMGFDDTEMARHVQPSLTSMRVPWADMARTATLLLQEVIRGTDISESKIQFRTTLVVRDSCGSRVSSVQAAN